MKIEVLLTRLEAAIPKLEAINERVSSASVGWQIEHSFKVIMGVCKIVQASDPKEYSASFNAKKTLLLFWGRFPRGVAKAPKATRPTGEITQQGLKDHLALVRAELPKINELHANAFFYHPIFKNLNLKETKRFIALHTNHHLRIIEDILK